MNEPYDLLKSILLEKSVRTGTFTLASGKVSDLYVDCRMTALDPVAPRWWVPWAGSLSGRRFSPAFRKLRRSAA